MVDERGHRRVRVVVTQLRRGQHDGVVAGLDPLGHPADDGGQHTLQDRYAAAICAASTGLITPGRKATRNLRVRVSRISAAVVSQASSQNVPVGVSTPVKPSRSAARATSAR